MRTDFDVAVLGAGIAGAAAALAAADTGARVCVITSAPGASALFSGAWRGAPPEAFQDHLGRAGYELHACDHALPHPNGARVRCHSATAAHRSAQLHDRALICGIAGLPGFDAPMLARLWGDGEPFAATVLTLPATPGAGWSPASLAAWIERETDEFGQALRAVVGRAQASRVILPAVLGLDDPATVPARLQDATGVTIGEALGTAPSVPGWRLHHALARALRAAGVHIFQGRARLGDHAAARVQTVTLDGATLQAHNYVLASGKFISGGIDADHALREPAFNCPIWIEHLDNVFTTSEPLMLTDPERSEPQPLLRAGVHCDAQHRPVDREGDVVFENLYVAGSVRADWDASSHGAGDCARDGWHAGLQAVQR